jgi:hypothetical protein
MTLEWESLPSVAWTELAATYAERIRQGVRKIADRRSPEIEKWMRTNAPWKDKSSNARQTLNTDVQGLAMAAVAIQLAHGMEYGIYLELANGGTYAIIGPALDYWSPIVWADVHAMLS